jgi:hypothetical protein
MKSLLVGRESGSGRCLRRQARIVVLPLASRDRRVDVLDAADAVLASRGLRAVASSREAMLTMQPSTVQSQRSRRT